MIARLAMWLAAVTDDLARCLERVAHWLGRFGRDDFALWEAELNSGVIPDFIGKEQRDGHL